MAQEMSRNMIFNDLKKHQHNQNQIYWVNGKQKLSSKGPKNYSSREYLGLVQASAEKNEATTDNEPCQQINQGNTRNTREQFESQGDQQYTSNEPDKKEPTSNFNRYQSQQNTESNHQRIMSKDQRTELLKEYQAKKMILEEL